MARSLFVRLHDRFAVRRIDRREMIRQSLAAAAGLVLSDHLTFARPRASAPRVVVVGAGFAGLSAAFELSRGGCAVTVLEARNRIGGRVISFHDLVPGGHMEGGAELIGSNHALWLHYKERFGLTFLDVTEEDAEAPIVLGGRRLTAAESERLWEEMSAALSLLNADAATITDPFTPWTAPGAADLDRRSLGEWIDGLQSSALCRTGVDAQMTADNGVRCAWQSYLGNLAMIKGGGVEKYWTETEVFRCAGGNQQLAQRLAREVGFDRVQLRQPVSRITLTDRGAEVVTAAGVRHECDHVILAVPPPTWNRIAFTPPLPIRSVPQMGSNVKFLMVAKDHFWRRAHLAPDSMSDGPVHITWHGTDGQRTKQAGMVAFSGGPAADECRSWSATERNDRYLDALSRAYRGVRASFVRARFMDWPSDPLVKASYSFPAPGEVTTIGPLLQTPVSDRLHFAGEHTCPAFVGYMEGALQSGVRCARRILTPAQASSRL